MRLCNFRFAKMELFLSCYCHRHINRHIISSLLQFLHEVVILSVVFVLEYISHPKFVHLLSLSSSSSSLHNEGKLSQQSCTSTASHDNGEKRIFLEIVNIRLIQTSLSHDNFFVGGNVSTIVTNIVLHAIINYRLRLLQILCLQAYTINLSYTINIALSTIFVTIVYDNLLSL